MVSFDFASSATLSLSNSFSFPVIVQNYLVCFLLCHMAGGVSVPQPGTEPTPSAMKVWS